MLKVKVGIVGLGRSGWCTHASLIGSLLEQYLLVATFDQDKARLKESAEKFSCRVYDDYENFLKDKEVELVVVATPSHLHADHTVRALQAGKNVICEKPMATSLAEADQMITAAQKSKKILTVFQNRRYVPDFLKVKEVIRSGRLGEIVLIRISQHAFNRRTDWQTLKEFGGGMLNNWGSHCLDQVLLLLGDKEPEIFCDLRHTVSAGDADDHVKVVLKTKGSPVIDVEISSCVTYPQENWFVVGTCGGIRGTESELHIKWFNSEQAPSLKLKRESTDKSYGAPENLPWQTEIWKASDSGSIGQIQFYFDLYATLRRGQPLAVTPESVRRLIALLEKCRQVSRVR